MSEFEETQRVWGKPPLIFSHPAIEDYWKCEVSMNCRESLDRLRKICHERGCDYQKTIARLRS